MGQSSQHLPRLHNIAIALQCRCASSPACMLPTTTEGGAVPQDVVFSFPVTCKGGDWTIVQGLDIDEKSAAKLKATGDELVDEKQLALQCLQE